MNTLSNSVLSDVSEDQHTVIAWKVKNASPKVASVRIRCMLPAVHLDSIGINSIIVQSGETLSSFEGISALVFVKTFSKEDWKLAIRAMKANVPIVIDLCDNIFVSGYGGDLYDLNWGCFHHIAKLASLIVTTNKGLEDLIREKSGNTARTCVIYDQLETRNDIDVIYSSLESWRDHPVVVPRKSLGDVLGECRSAIRTTHIRLEALLRYNLSIKNGSNLTISRASALPSKLVRRPARGLEVLMHSILYRTARKVAPKSRFVTHYKKRITRNKLPSPPPLSKRSVDEAASERSEPAIRYSGQNIDLSATNSSTIGPGVTHPFFADSPATGSGETTADLPQVIWFGNQGVNNGKYGMNYSKFGMQSLLLIKKELVDAYNRTPFKLLVVSKSKRMYEEFIAPFPIPTLYRNWDPYTIFDDINTSSVCIIPNPKDEFSMYKSPNRALLSLSLGVPVVAASIPSFEPLKDCIVTDDWVEGISGYLEDRNKASDDVILGNRLIEDMYSGSAIANSWATLLERLQEAPHGKGINSVK